MAMATALWILVVVDDARLYLEDQQHGVVLMHGIVAVHGPVALEVAETEEERICFVELEPSDVLPCDLHGRYAVGIGATVAAVAGVPARVLEFGSIMVSAGNSAQNLVLFQMDMDGVLPVVSWVNENPIFGAVLLHGEAVHRAVGKLLVDDPLAVVAVEDEVARDARRHDAGQRIERGPRGGINAIVSGRGADLKLQTIGACAWGEDIASRPR